MRWPNFLKPFEADVVVISLTGIVDRTRGALALAFGPRRVTPARRSLLQRPTVVLMTFFALALLAMAYVDRPLGQWMLSFPKELVGLARFITDLGEGLEVLVVTGVLTILGLCFPVARLSRQVRAGFDSLAAGSAYVFFAVAGGGIVSNLVKNMIGRARPRTLNPIDPFVYDPFAFKSAFAAFPSGHSATAGAMAMALALMFPRLRGILIPIGVLVCMTRLFLGAHWTSDALMGWAVGVAFALWLAHHLAGRGLVFGYGADGRLAPRRPRRSLRAVWRALGQGLPGWMRALGGAVATEARVAPGLIKTMGADMISYGRWLVGRGER
jgi:membrane-associated phospholipid phosphatase